MRRTALSWRACIAAAIGVVALFLASCASWPRARSNDSELAIQKEMAAAALVDADYHGGLSEEDEALAERLAAAAGLAPAAKCTEPDPMAGVLVGSVGPKPKSVGLGDPSIEPGLRALAVAAVDGATRHQRDVAARALGKLGQAARPVMTYLDEHADASPWLREVDGTSTCQRVTAVDQTKVLVSELDCSPSGCKDEQYCSVVRLLLRRMRESVRIWPAEVLSSREFRRCQYDDALPDLVASVLANPQQTAELRSDLLRLAESLVRDSLSTGQCQQWLAAVEPSLLEIAEVGEEQDRWNAETILIILGARSAPQHLARRITAESEVGWSEHVCAYSDHAAVLVPALVKRLGDDRNWVNRAEAAKRLRCFSTVADVSALVEALAAPDYVLQEEAIRTLSRRRPLPASARAALEQLAMNHWAPRLQRLAREAARGSIADPEQTPNTICIGMCQPDMEQSPCRGDAFDDGAYQLDGEGTFDVHWNAIVDKSRRLELPDALATRPEYCEVSELRTDAVRLVGTVCLEYSGGLYAIDAKNQITQLFDQGTVGAFAVRGRTLAVAAAYFFSPSYAAIMSVDPHATDQAAVKPLSAWPGLLPDHYAYSPSGKLLLSNGSAALALDESGRISRLRCP